MKGAVRLFSQKGAGQTLGLLFEDNEAVVRTTEYWYLRWWSTIEQKYRYPYHETIRHTYMMVKTPDGWRVEENIHPAPRSSTPHRQRK